MSNYTESRRVGFVIIDGKVIFQSDDNRISTISWMKDELGLSDEQIANTIRGGIFIDKITLCKGEDYKPINMNELTALQFISILDKYSEKFCNVPVEIHNGCKIGEYGENWEPIQVIGRGTFIRNTICKIL